MAIKCLIFGHNWIYSNKKKFYDFHDMEVELYTKRICKNCGKEQEMEHSSTGLLYGDITKHWVSVK